MQPIKDANFRLLVAFLVAVVLLGSLPWVMMWVVSFMAKFWPAMIAAAHILFATGIWRDATQRRERILWLFLDPITWAVGVLVFGLFTVALYWAVHYSRLRAD